jgi:hypothetical protein
MTVGRDELWVDMTQFDTRVADGVWDGEAPDPDAPRWFADLRSLVHRARGPAEPDELVDEPVLVDRMRRATLGEAITDLPHRAGVRTVGRLVAMKAAAATTASVMTVAAAAATTGIVATVAATVVVPAIHERIMPIIGDEGPPAAEAPVQTGSDADVAPGDVTTRSCDPDRDCVQVSAEPTVDGTGEPVAPAAETTEPESDTAPAAAADEPAAEQGPAAAPESEATTTTETSPATTTTATSSTTTTSTTTTTAPKAELPPAASIMSPPAEEPSPASTTTTDPAQVSPSRPPAARAASPPSEPGQRPS